MEARCHTLLYVVMTNTNGHQVSGHVDLADRVAKVSQYRSDKVNIICYCVSQIRWKEGIKDKSWILPKSGDLTFKRKDQVNYCSSVNWDVVIKDNVVKLLHIRTSNEILVGSTIKKKWNKVKNRIFKKDEDANNCSNGNGWKDLISEKCLNISYFNIDNP